MRSTTELRASWEDGLLAVMAPRSGKTTALAVPAVLDALGAMVVTSNKADLWLVTEAARAQRGTVWTFDPQSSAYAPRAWWWNPLAGVDSIEDAHRLAQHFLSAKAEEDFWDKAASSYCPLSSSPLPSVRGPWRTCSGGSPTAPPRPPSAPWTAPGTGRPPARCAARRAAHPRPAKASTRPHAPRRRLLQAPRIMAPAPPKTCPSSSATTTCRCAPAAAATPESQTAPAFADSASSTPTRSAPCPGAQCSSPRRIPEVCWPGVAPFRGCGHASTPRRQSARGWSGRAWSARWTGVT